jgi:hypothetical protein
VILNLNALNKIRIAQRFIFHLIYIPEACLFYANDIHCSMTCISCTTIILCARRYSRPVAFKMHTNGTSDVFLFLEIAEICFATSQMRKLVAERRSCRTARPIWGKKLKNQTETGELSSFGCRFKKYSTLRLE